MLFRSEYEGLLAGLRAARSLGIHRLLVKGDSQLVANQVGKEYQCSSTKMSSYLAEVRKLEKHFFGFQIQHIIPRKDNFLAGKLARMASTRSPVPPGVFLEQLDSPSVVELSEDTDVHKEVAPTFHH